MKYKYITLNLLTPFTKSSPGKIGEHLSLYTSTTDEILNDKAYSQTETVVRNFSTRKLTIIESNLEILATDIIGMMQISTANRLDEIKLLCFYDSKTWFFYVPTQLIMHFENKSLIHSISERYATHYLDEQKCKNLEVLLPSYQTLNNQDPKLFLRLHTSHKFCKQYWKYIHIENDYEEAFLKIIMAFESILNFEKAEILKSIKGRLQKINGEDPSEIFSRFYDQRSKYIHTGNIHITKNKPISFEDFKYMETLLCQTHANIVKNQISFLDLKKMF